MSTCADKEDKTCLVCSEKGCACTICEYISNEINQNYPEVVGTKVDASKSVSTPAEAQSDNIDNVDKEGEERTWSQWFQEKAMTCMKYVGIDEHAMNHRAHTFIKVTGLADIAFNTSIASGEEKKDDPDKLLGWHKYAPEAKNIRIRGLLLAFFVFSKILFPLFDFGTDLQMVFEFAYPTLVGYQVCIEESTLGGLSFNDVPQWSLSFDGNKHQCGLVDNRVVIESSSRRRKLIAEESPPTYQEAQNFNSASTAAHRQRRLSATSVINPLYDITDQCSSLSSQTACEEAANGICRWGPITAHSTTIECYDPVLQTYLEGDVDELQSITLRDYEGLYCSEFQPAHRGETAGTANATESLCLAFTHSYDSSELVCDWNIAYSYCAVKESFRWYMSPDNCRQIGQGEKTYNQEINDTCSSTCNCEYIAVSDGNSTFRCIDSFYNLYLDSPTSVSVNAELNTQDGYCKRMQNTTCCNAIRTQSNPHSDFYNNIYREHFTDYASAMGVAGYSGYNTDDGYSNDAALCCVIDGSTACPNEYPYVCRPNLDYAVFDDDTTTTNLYQTCALSMVDTETSTSSSTNYQSCLASDANQIYGVTGIQDRLCSQCTSCNQILHSNQMYNWDTSTTSTDEQSIAEGKLDLWTTSFSCCACNVIKDGQTCSVTKSQQGSSADTIWGDACENIIRLPDAPRNMYATDIKGNTNEHTVSSDRVTPYEMRAGNSYEASLACRGTIDVVNSNKLCQGLFGNAYQRDSKYTYKTRSGEMCVEAVDNTWTYTRNTRETCQARYIDNPATTMQTKGFDLCYERDVWASKGCMDFDEIVVFNQQYINGKDTSGTYTIDSCVVDTDDSSGATISNYTQYRSCCWPTYNGGGNDGIGCSPLNSKGRCRTCGCVRSGNQCVDPIKTLLDENVTEAYYDLRSYCYYMNREKCCTSWTDTTASSTTYLCEWDDSRAGGTVAGLAKCQPKSNTYVTGSCTTGDNACVCVENTVAYFKDPYSNDAKCPHKGLCYLQPQDECDHFRYTHLNYPGSVTPVYETLNSDGSYNIPAWTDSALYIDRSETRKWIRRWKPGSLVCTMTQENDYLNSTGHTNTNYSYHFSSVDTYVEGGETGCDNEGITCDDECRGFRISFGCESSNDQTTIGDYLQTPLGLFAVCQGSPYDRCRHCSLMGIFALVYHSMFSYGDALLSFNAEHFIVTLIQSYFTFWLLIIVVIREFLGLGIVVHMVNLTRKYDQKRCSKHKIDSIVCEDMDFVTIGRDSVVGLIFMFWALGNIYRRGDEESKKCEHCYEPFIRCMPSCCLICGTAEGDSKTANDDAKITDNVDHVITSNVDDTGNVSSNKNAVDDKNDDLVSLGNDNGEVELTSNVCDNDSQRSLSIKVNDGTDHTAANVSPTSSSQISQKPQELDALNNLLKKYEGEGMTGGWHGMSIYAHRYKAMEEKWERTVRIRKRHRHQARLVTWNMGKETVKHATFYGSQMVNTVSSISNSFGTDSGRDDNSNGGGSGRLATPTEDPDHSDDIGNGSDTELHGISTNHDELDATSLLLEVKDLTISTSIDDGVVDKDEDTMLASRPMIEQGETSSSKVDTPPSLYRSPSAQARRNEAEEIRLTGGTANKIESYQGFLAKLAYTPPKGTFSTNKKNGDPPFDYVSDTDVGSSNDEDMTVASDLVENINKREGLLMTTHTRVNRYLTEQRSGRASLFSAPGFDEDQSDTENSSDGDNDPVVDNVGVSTNSNNDNTDDRGVVTELGSNRIHSMKERQDTARNQGAAEAESFHSEDRMSANALNRTHHNGRPHLAVDLQKDPALSFEQCLENFIVGVGEEEAMENLVDAKPLWDEPNSLLLNMWGFFEIVENLCGIGLGSVIIYRLAVASHPSMVPSQTEVFYAAFAFFSSYIEMVLQGGKYYFPTEPATINPSGKIPAEAVDRSAEKWLETPFHHCAFKGDTKNIQDIYAHSMEKLVLNIKSCVILMAERDIDGSDTKSNEVNEVVDVVSSKKAMSSPDEYKPLIDKIFEATFGDKNMHVVNRLKMTNLLNRRRKKRKAQILDKSEVKAVSKVEFDEEETRYINNYLLKHFINGRDSYGWTPLHAAAFGVDIDDDISEFSASNNPNHFIPKGSIKHRFFNSLKKKNKKKGTGSDKNDRDNRKDMKHKADHVTSCEMLLTIGADPLLKVREGKFDALHIAMYCYNDDIVEVLKLHHLTLFKGKAFHYVDRGTYRKEYKLFFLILKGCLVEALQLLGYEKSGESDDDGKDNSKSDGNNTETVKEDFDLHSKDPDGWNALHYAAYFGHVELVRVLLQKGVSPHTWDSCMWTPLNVARHRLEKDRLQEDDPEVYQRMSEVMRELEKANGFRLDYVRYLCSPHFFKSVVEMALILGMMILYAYIFNTVYGQDACMV